MSWCCFKLAGVDTVHAFIYVLGPIATSPIFTTSEERNCLGEQQVPVPVGGLLVCTGMPNNLVAETTISSLRWKVANNCAFSRRQQLSRPREASGEDLNAAIKSVVPTSIWRSILAIGLPCLVFEIHPQNSASLTMADADGRTDVGNRWPVSQASNNNHAVECAKTIQASNIVVHIIGQPRSKCCTARHTSHMARSVQSHTWLFKLQHLIVWKTHPKTLTKIHRPFQRINQGMGAVLYEWCTWSGSLNHALTQN